jgi:hypothetical protein
VKRKTAVRGREDTPEGEERIHRAQDVEEKIHKRMKRGYIRR